MIFRNSLKSTWGEILYPFFSSVFPWGIQDDLKFIMDELFHFNSYAFLNEH